MDEWELRQNLATLFSIFNDKPNLLAKYIIDNKLLSEDTINYINNNEEISKKRKSLKDNDNIETPFFRNFKEMKEYYDKFFKKDKTLNDVLSIKKEVVDEVEDLRIQLHEAISIEDYEKCMKIRDYCSKKNIIL